MLKEECRPEMAADLSRVAGHVHAALPIAGSDTGDYLVRNLLGIDPVLLAGDRRPCRAGRPGDVRAPRSAERRRRPETHAGALEGARQAAARRPLRVVHRPRPQHVRRRRWRSA
ncbi:MAG: hypothetical protein U5O69_02515 [Candidatus Competibacteraceae bacterium]|nr:hypothetical protein [Candidatus Competibacteraceae bacterium]